MRNNRQHKKLKSGIYTQWCYKVILDKKLTEDELDDLYEVAEARNIWLVAFGDSEGYDTLLFHNNKFLTDVLIFEKIDLRNFLESVQVGVNHIKIKNSEGDRVIREEVL